MRVKRPLISTAIILVALSSASAWSQDHHRGGGAGPSGWHGPGLVLDQRFQHNHYYPPSGRIVATVPSGAVTVSFGSGQFYFHSGVWFRPHGGRFIVTLPPIGIVLPLLPSAYVTLQIGGLPYYYANGVYYAQVPGQGYAVVAPPAGADGAAPMQGLPAPVESLKPAPVPIFYPRNGQSASQLESDIQECNRWATTQANAMSDASVFQRAVAACMDGRGYTVR